MSPLLRQEIAKLSHHERADLIDELIVADARDEDGFTPEQAAEIDRRLATLDEDSKTTVPWEVVRADFESSRRH